MSTEITPHFTLESCEYSDYATAHNISNLVPEDLKPNGARLCAFAEEVRSLLSGHYGKDVAMMTSSVYRGPDLNHAVGGEPTSQHMRFEAMDFHTNVGDLDTDFEVIKDSDLEYDQLIMESDKEGHRWIHVSVPNDGETARREVLEGEKGFRLNRVAVG